MNTTHEYRGYVFTIGYQPDDPAYTVAFADFADIVTSGATLADAFANACEASTCTWRACKNLASRCLLLSIELL